MLSNKIHYLLLNLLLFTNTQILYFKRPLSTRSPEESGDIYKEKNTNRIIPFSCVTPLLVDFTFHTVSLMTRQTD